MADEARILTDEKLEKMERHLSAIYSRAHKELSEKYENYILKFEEADKKKRKLLENGKITEREYQRWRKGQIATGSYWRNMKEQTAKQLLHVNEIALAYVNDQLPEIYAINYNWSAKDLEMQIHNAISFELVDAQTVKNLSLIGDKSLLPYKEIDPTKDIPWNMQKINAEVLQGILQGESILKIAKRIRNVEKMNKVSSIRSARTAVTAAENKARQDSAESLEKMGAIVKKAWLSVGDSRTRDWHKQAANDYSEEKAIPVNSLFVVNGEEMSRPGDAEHGATGSNLYNCRCSSKNIVVGFKSTLPPELRGKYKVKFNGKTITNN